MLKFAMALCRTLRALRAAQQLPSEIPNGCPALAAGGTVAPNGCGVATATTAGGKVSFIVSVPPGNEGNAMLVVVRAHAVRVVSLTAEHPPPPRAVQVYNSQAQTTGWSAGSNPCFDVRPPSGNRSAPYTWTGGRWTCGRVCGGGGVCVVGGGTR